MGFAFGNGPEKIDLSKGGDKGSTPRPSLPVPPTEGLPKPSLPHPGQSGVPTPPSIQRPANLPSLPNMRPAPVTPPQVQQPVYQEQTPVQEHYPTQGNDRNYTEDNSSYNNNQGYDSGYNQVQNLGSNTEHNQRQNHEHEDSYNNQQYSNYQNNDYDQSQGNSYNEQPQQYRDDSFVERSRPQQNTSNGNRNPRNNMFNNSQQNRPQPVQEEPVELDKKGRPIKKKAVKQKKASSFAGDRKKVLFARISVYSILGILILSGLGSFMPKTTGLSASDGPLILSKVRQDLGITAFPQHAGAAWAIAFSKTYLTYDPEKREQRYSDLLQYAPENVLKLIDLRVASPEELATIGQDIKTPTDSDSEETTGEEDTTTEPGTDTGTETGTGTDTGTDAGTSTEAPVDGVPAEVKPGSGKMIVTDGPYLVRSVMVAGGTDAIFTTRTQVNGKTWLFMEVPMKYDAETRALSVSGSPTFVQGIEPAQVKDPRYGSFDNDGAVYDAVVEDLRGYMKAWASGDSTSVERFLLKKDGKVAASLEAQTGLNGEVIYMSSPELLIETKPKPEEGATAAQEADYRERQARMTVRWLEPQSGITYDQTYELTLNYANDDWFVSDIKNIATSAGESKDRI